MGRGPVALVATRGLASAVRVDRPLVERVVAPSALDLPVARASVWARCVCTQAVASLRGERSWRSGPLREPSFGDRLGFYTGRTFDHIGDWFS